MTPEAEFGGWVARVKNGNLDVVAGPREQRGGKTILFRTPSGNIVEICYPFVRETIASLY